MLSKSRKRLWIIGFVLVVAAVALFQTPFPAASRQYVWDAATPFLSSFQGLLFWQQEDVQEVEMERLAGENVQLRAQLQDYYLLREQLAAPSVDEWKQEEALITGRPADPIHTSFFINKGFADGVGVGDPVTVYGNTILGFVGQTQEHSAVVDTLFHPKTNLHVVTVPADEDARSANGLLVSRFQTSLHMTTVPRDREVRLHEPIVTSDQNELVPLGLIIGQAAEVRDAEHEAYQTVRVQISYNPDEIRGVTVLKRP